MLKRSNRKSFRKAFRMLYRYSKLVVLFIVIPLLAASISIPALARDDDDEAGHTSFDLAVNGYGIGFGNSAWFRGLRFNWKDEDGKPNYQDRDSDGDDSDVTPSCECNAGTGTTTHEGWVLLLVIGAFFVLRRLR